MNRRRIDARSAPRLSDAFDFDMLALERRVLLSSAAAAGIAAPTTAASSVSVSARDTRVLRAYTPSNLLTKAARQALLNNWSGSDKAVLQAALNSNDSSGFDQQLLNYMVNRTNASFYFQPSDVGSYISWIQSNINTANTIQAADEIVSHLFPKTPDSSSYTNQLPSGDIDWTGTKGETNAISALNRQSFWMNLATAYRLTGDSKYSTELTSELASWSKQNPALADANTWPSSAPHWNLLDTSVRAASWVWAYSLMVGSAGWTPEANTLFLYKMEQTGEFLRAATPISIGDNRAIIQYSGLLGIADLFPEFTAAADWRSYGHKKLFAAMNAQTYADGSDAEQSPGYTSVVLNELLDAKLLDQDNGYTWPSAQRSLLSNALTAYEQMLSPNGDRAALGDTYRASAAPLWLEADLVQGTTAFPAAKPRIHDVWLFGPNTVSNYMGNPITPDLPDRGQSYALPDSGNYVMRSGGDPNARQIIFQAGPKGGNHGHFDLLNFELSGYGHPLISDPGLVRYDTSADRIYAISTPAHNTISADGLNTGDLEGEGNPGVVVDQWDPEANFVQVTAHHTAYSYLAGSPTLTRSIWYDYDGTMLIIDWASGSASHSYSVGFNLPGTAHRNSDGSIQSTNGSGDVKITPMLLSGQTTKAVNRFVSNTSSPDESPAVHYSISQSGKFVAFATLVTTYTGSTPPDITAQLLTTPAAGKAVTVRLTKNGVAQDIRFTPPRQVIPNSRGTVSASNTSVAYDSRGQLHMAYYDPVDGHLKYTVRGTNGQWSAVQTVDILPEAGMNPSIAINSQGRPGIAYYDGTNADLKYAYLDPAENTWQVQTVDSAGTTGQFPSLVFSHHDGACISYYDRTHHALKIAQPVTSGWSIQTVDKSADVGRYSSLSLDPSRPTASKLAVSYEDTTHHAVKYAVQAGSGWTIDTVDSGGVGGLTSLAFDSSNLPAIAYYDAKETAVKIGRYNGKSKTFSTSFVASAGTVGQDPNVLFNKSGQATVFYSDATHHRAEKATQKGSKWILTNLAAGGREIHVARYGSTVAYTDANAGGTQSSVFFT